jgi:hypothetical protein
MSSRVNKLFFLCNIVLNSLCPAHHRLCKEKMILHRDISYHNTMLYRPESSELCKGLLIDLDYASKLESEGNVHGPAFLCRAATIYALTSQGMGAFMVVQILLTARAGEVMQTTAHDLKLFFYVLLYICCNFKGPCQQKSCEDLGDDLYPLYSWFNDGIDFADLTGKKIISLMSFQSNFIDWFSPYFANLGPCITKLFNHIFPAAAD